jgi:hypothetical protein
MVVSIEVGEELRVAEVWFRKGGDDNVSLGTWIGLEAMKWFLVPTVQS